MRGAHDDKQQSAWPGARCEERAVGRAAREGARTAQHASRRPKSNNTLIVNKRQTIRFVLL